MTFTVFTRTAARRRLSTFLLFLALGVLVLIPVAHQAGAADTAVTGRVMVRDISMGTTSSQSSDRLQIALTGATPPPAGRSLRSYLFNGTSGGRYVGALSVTGGAINATFDFPYHNLIGGYDTFQLMQEAVVFSATVPAGTLTFIRTALVQANDTPDAVGYAVGLLSQGEILALHAGFARDAVNANNLSEAKMHVEHVLNTLYGATDPRYGDYNNDGFADNPGDGYGLLRYSSALSQTLAVAASSIDATQHIKDRVAEVKVSLDNIGVWSPLLIARAQEVLNAANFTAAQTPVTQMAGFATRMCNGVDLNDNGQVEPIKDEGGVQAAYHASQRTADYVPAPATGITGSVQHRNVGSDQLFFALTGAPPLGANEEYQIYLLDVNREWYWLGGVASVTNSTKTGNGLNLIEQYDTLYLTRGLRYAADTLPTAALNHLRTALVYADDTPSTVGYAVGLLSQGEILALHAGFAKEAVDANNLSEAKMHVEHVLNTLYGAADPRYGDYNNDGFADNPGDGYGLLRYSANLSETLPLAANTSDATQPIKDRVAEVQVTLANLNGWAPLLIDRAEAVLNATNATNAQTPVTQFAGFATRMFNGVDLNDNGQVEPIKDEGGVQTAYVTTQQATDYFPQGADLPGGTPTATPPPGATPTATPPLTPGVGDAYEEDDTCGQARVITTDGATQDRAFHDEGDKDWIRFTAQANTTYVIEVTNVGARSDAVILLHDACSQSPSATQDNAFGSVVRLEWDSTKNGDYFIQLQQFDPSFFGADANYRLAVRADSVPPVAPKNLRCVAVNETTLGLQWQKNTERDVNRYRVTYRNENSTVSGNRDVDGGSETYVEVDGLTANQLYFLRVVAIDYSNNESAASGEIPCRAADGADTTPPSLTVQQPAAANVFSTTAGSITFAGLAQDASGNLSQVRAHNITLNVEGRDYTLSGASDDFRVENLALDVGDNTIELTVYDEAGNSSKKTVTVKRLGASPGAVLIVAGHNETFALQTNIYNAANRAYRIFKNAGFTDDDIYYIAPVEQKPEGTVNRVDATTSPAAVQAAILTWAKENGRVGPDKPFFVYLMDHGFADKYCVSGCNDAGKITPTDLNNWLRTLETETGVDEVNVIIEACQSGSFLDRLNGEAQDIANSLSRAGRVIITSTDRVNNAYASAQGAYFSDAFFSCLADSGHLKACFDQGVAAVAATGVEQVPWLDDNGDGLANGNDGTVAQNRVVTRFFSSIRPQITGATLERQGANGTLTATIEEGAEAIDIVWAAIYPPSFEEPEGVTLNLNVPTVRLEPDPSAPGRYTFTYPNGFTEAGDYRVIFYAQDTEGIHATPRQPGAGGSLYLPLINR
ncbi:MAG: fibronectin type III domain-containing protein [Caldilineaceae bacterium]